MIRPAEGSEYSELYGCHTAFNRYTSWIAAKIIADLNLQIDEQNFGIRSNARNKRSVNLRLKFAIVPI